MKHSEFIAHFKAARKATVPLIGVRTYDATSATRGLIASFSEKSRSELPIVLWDIVNGLTGFNKPGQNIVPRLTEEPQSTVDPTTALICLAKMPADGLIFMNNLHRVWQSAPVRQAVWNLRDIYKANGCTLVLNMSPGTTLPEGLTDDVLVLDEPLPTEEELGNLFTHQVKIYEDERKVKLNVGGKTSKAVDALIGMPMFPSEQSIAMHITDEGVDFDAIWERKRQQIEQTKGLKIWRGTEKFADLGGGDNVKGYLASYIKNCKPRAIVFIDEVEKMFAGAGTESTGIKSGFLAKFLSWMQDNDIDGLLCIGHPGCMKSALAKAAGNEAECPTIAFDVTGMQQKEVGSSEENLTRGLGMVDAIACGRVLVIATCNSMGQMPNEFKRRFTLGTFFFDLPTAKARMKIWEIYRDKYNLDYELPDDEGWTGAEIRECVRKASRLKMTFDQASKFVVPISRSGADKIRSLRVEASGKYLDAEQSGIFEYSEQAAAQSTAIERKVRTVRM